MTIRHALVVDDSKSARMMLQRLLSKMNVESEAVENAEEALRFLQNKQPDVIFMDHMMPGMDGLEATQMIKSNPLTAAIPTIMYTSKEDHEYHQMALSHGAQGVLAKPASQDAIMAVIQSLDEPAANDESSALATQIPLIEIDKLIEKRLKDVISEARAEISAAIDNATHQLQKTQNNQLELMQTRLSQKQEAFQYDVRAQLSEQELFQKTRQRNQRLAAAVADKMVKKSADDLITIVRTSQTSLKADLASLREQLSKEVARRSKHALITGLAGGAIIGGLIGIVAALSL